MKAESEVKMVHPDAYVCRDTFGMVVMAGPDGPKLGEGRCYYEEEAWLEAAQNLPDE